ncbi:ethanolamine ammonia-lyase subunit EutC [Muricoccus radiodurans]|uniref:ethanolamine ammonia-lyase subunit EutC n=1 Tax=Muricoccus radiodurans TaxID=2231721 RepID=UPI003CE73AAB
MSEVAPLSFLRRHTTARVALGRAGAGLPTAAHLDFQEAHARARDAVWSALDEDALEAALRPLGLPVIRVASAAPDRRSYLLRPDLGRRLATADPLPRAEGRIVFVVADGLCATGVQDWAPPVLAALLPRLSASALEAGPILIARQARVALGDAAAEAMGAAAVVVLIGERPGLSAQDSLGAYLTWAARVGRADSERNCVSNIRAAGLAPEAAAAKIAWLLSAARDRGGTGVGLKDEQPATERLRPPGV